MAQFINYANITMHEHGSKLNSRTREPSPVAMDAHCLLSYVVNNTQVRQALPGGAI